MGSVLGSFGVMHCIICGAILSHSGDFEPFWWFWAILGHSTLLRPKCPCMITWTPLGPFQKPTWPQWASKKGPRMVQHDTYWFCIPMGSVSGSFGAFLGNIWVVAPFIPVGNKQKNWKWDFFRYSPTGMRENQNLYSRIYLLTKFSLGQMALSEVIGR